MAIALDFEQLWELVQARELQKCKKPMSEETLESLYLKIEDVIEAFVTTSNEYLSGDLGCHLWDNGWTSYFMAKEEEDECPEELQALDPEGSFYE